MLIKAKHQYNHWVNMIELVQWNSFRTINCFIVCIYRLKELFIENKLLLDLVSSELQSRCVRVKTNLGIKYVQTFQRLFKKRFQMCVK